MNESSNTGATPLSFSKKRGKHCAAIDCNNSYYDEKGLFTGHHFFMFPTEIQRRN